jgi:hypothetical protein
MARKTTKVTSIALPIKWINTLKDKARKLAVKHNKDISYVDLIRKAIKKQYKIKD